MKSRCLSRGLGIAAGLAILSAVALTLLPAAAWQTTLLNTTRQSIAVIIGADSALIGRAPLLLKLLFFAVLALLVWGTLFAGHASPGRTLCAGIAVALLTAAVLEELQALLPGRQYALSDGVWCAATGCLTALFLFLCQWAGERFPRLVNRETVLYVAFGGITTAVNILSFQICVNQLGIPTLVANGIAWVLSVLVAYTTNKLFVFESRTATLIAFLREIGLFFGARLLSFGVDELGIWLLVDVAHFHSGLSKIATNVIVLILNYLFSKWFIFADKKEK